MTIHITATKMARIAITRIARRLGIFGSLIFYSVGEKVHYVLKARRRHPCAGFTSVLGPGHLTLAAALQRSTSPKTISIDPRIAVMSGSIWPRDMKSIACKWLKPVGRILQRYGLLLPSLTR